MGITMISRFIQAFDFIWKRSIKITDSESKLNFVGSRYLSTQSILDKTVEMGSTPISEVRVGFGGKIFFKISEKGIEILQLLGNVERKVLDSREPGSTPFSIYLKLVLAVQVASPLSG